MRLLLMFGIFLVLLVFANANSNLIAAVDRNVSGTSVERSLASEGIDLSRDFFDQSQDEFY